VRARDADVVAEEAWELVVEGRRVLGNVCVLGRTLQMRDEEEEDADADGLRARWDLLDSSSSRRTPCCFGCSVTWRWGRSRRGRTGPSSGAM
jgi:hypothetical protein